MQDNEIKPWLKESGVFSKAERRVVYHMEDVLEVYQRPEDARFR